MLVKSWTFGFIVLFKNPYFHYVFTCSYFWSISCADEAITKSLTINVGMIYVDYIIGSVCSYSCNILQVILNFNLINIGLECYALWFR